MLSVVPGEGTEPLNSCQYWILGVQMASIDAQLTAKQTVTLLCFRLFFPQKTKILWISFS